MGDDIKLDKDESKKSLDDQPKATRRRFAKTGLGGGAVLMSLLSRSAFGSSAQCSTSILASYNLSAHPDLAKCEFACEPNHWQLHSWDEYVPGGFSSGEPFCDAFSINKDYFIEEDPLCEAIFTQTLGQILNGGCPEGYQSIGEHAVAALVNSKHDMVKNGCPYNSGGVITDFQMAYEHYYLNKGSGTENNLLDTFVAKYSDYYSWPNVACPIPNE